MYRIQHLISIHILRPYKCNGVKVNDVEVTVKIQLVYLNNTVNYKFASSMLKCIAKCNDNKIEFLV